MHTFPETRRGPAVQIKTAQRSGGAGPIIARTLWAAGLALMLLALGGCSTMRLAYNQAPTLAYFWFNDYLELGDAQATPFKQDLETYFQWHRTTELPLYAERLKQWQTLATQDFTAAQACNQFEAVRAAYLRGVERALPPLTRVALVLQAPQLEALAKKNAKGNRKFEEDWLSSAKEDRHERRLDKAMGRYEDLYGGLSAQQRQLLKSLIQRSGFDPKRVMAERQRRQQDLLTSLKLAQAQPEQAQAALRGWHERVMRSPDPAYAAYNKTAIEENCAQFAAMHQTTSPEQRAQAVKTLKGYEGDLVGLIGPAGMTATAAAATN